MKHLANKVTFVQIVKKHMLCFSVSRRARSSISRRSLLAPSLGLRVIFGTGTISGTTVLINFWSVLIAELFRK